MGEGLLCTSRLSFLLLLVWDCAQSYSALPVNKVQRSDSQRATLRYIPYVTACCVQWGPVHAASGMPSMLS